MIEEVPDFQPDIEQVADEKIPKLPVGTLAEILAEGLDPSLVPCCARPVRDPSTGKFVTVGCKLADDCDNPRGIKFQTGPRNFAMQMAKGPNMGGTVITRFVDCFWLAMKRRSMMENKASFKIIAEEGEKYMTQEIIAQPGKGKLGKAQAVERTVTPFVRPKDNPDLIEMRLAQAIHTQVQAQEGVQTHASSTGSLRPRGGSSPSGSRPEGVPGKT